MELISHETVRNAYLLAQQHYEPKFMEEHVMRVVATAMSMCGDNVRIDKNLVQCLAICHDLPEDTDVTFKLLAKAVSPKVSEGVKQLTKNKDGTYPHTTWRETAIVKMADRGCNLASDFIAQRPEKLKQYIEKASKINW